MEIFYHLSHLFEILTGIYFGGFALLGFLEKNASEEFLSKIQKRQNQQLKARVIAQGVYDSVNAEPFEKRGKKVLFAIVFWSFVCLEYFTNIAFSAASIKINKINSDGPKKMLLKKFFPSFFFNGCFTLVVILLSSIQEQDLNSANCHLAINYFFLYYTVSVFIFQIWGLLIFPRLVNKFEYSHLVFISVVLSAVLLYLSFHWAFNLNLKFGLGYFLVKQESMYLILIVVTIAFAPLLLLLLLCSLLMFAWEIPVLWYSLFQRIFYKPAGDSDVKKYKKESSTIIEE